MTTVHCVSRVCLSLWPLFIVFVECVYYCDHCALCFACFTSTENLTHHTLLLKFSLQASLTWQLTTNCFIFIFLLNKTLTLAKLKWELMHKTGLPTVPRFAGLSREFQIKWTCPACPANQNFVLPICFQTKKIARKLNNWFKSYGGLKITTHQNSKWEICKHCLL